MDTKFSEFVRNVVFHLGGWTYVETDHESHYGRTVTHPSGAKLLFFLNSRTGIVGVSPCYVNDKGTLYPREFSKRVQSINVSISRQPTAVAKDITKRVINDYLPSYQAGVEEYNTVQKYHNSKQKTVDEFCNILNRDCKNHQGKEVVSSYVFVSEEDKNSSIGVDVHVYSPKEVQLTLRSVPVEIAKKILDMFTKLPADKNTP